LRGFRRIQIRADKKVVKFEWHIFLLVKYEWCDCG
jgi:hypothetical protein